MKDEEAILFWWTIVATLKHDDLSTDRATPDAMAVPEADALVLPDRIIFVLDPVRSGGIQRSEWLNPRSLAKLEDALGGRRVVVSQADQFAVTVARTASQELEPTRTSR